MQKYETFMYLHYVHFFVHFFLVQGRTGNQDNEESLGQHSGNAFCQLVPSQL